MEAEQRAEQRAEEDTKIRIIPHLYGLSDTTPVANTAGFTYNLGTFSLAF